MYPNELADNTYSRVIWFNQSVANMTFRSSSNQDQGFILNVQRRGYYLVDYDEKLFSKISQQLLSDHRRIPVENRATFFSDTWRLVEYNETSVSKFLDLTRYLKNEKSATVWERVAQTFMILYPRIAENHSLAMQLNLYMSGLIEDHVKRIDFSWKDESMDYRARKLDYSIATIACQLDHEEFSRRAMVEFEKIKDNVEDNLLVSIFLAIFIHPELRIH
ncbi:hypothetical protein Ciccas_008074 [Cichlidogyrus casuarinus]|uniref:ERAP1-like C-terminal domain-containing protein n=1 Tax=Cichlidogyrus casuarinus TaxID=1844966 RepID=A0ABD2Q562_9PLAT